jgi:protein-tyrosine phosphatase
LNNQYKCAVLFICMGNICRSPMAEGVFRRVLADAGLVDQVYVDSAGTHADYHPHAPPDSRGQATALRRGVDLSDIRARLVAATDFAEFDHILAMDRDNLADLLARCRDAELRQRIGLLMDFAPDWPDREVPDPYYGGPDGFERVMDMIEAAAQGLLVHLRERHRI